MKKIISIFLCVLLLSCLFCGCTAPENSDKIKIVTTVFPVYDFARAAAGDKADVKMLIQPGSDIHSFEPTARDIAEIQNSDIFIYIGGESDVWVEKILSSVTLSNTSVVKMVDCVTLIEDDHGDFDEHIWTSPDNAVKMLARINTVLSDIDGENAAYYTARTADYTENINAAAADIRNVIENSHKKTIVVADRFPFVYFTEYFSLEYAAAFGGCEHDTDAGLSTVTALIDTVKHNNLTAVYRVELSDLSVADTVAAATGAEILELHSAQNISAEDFNAGVTYVDIMQKNCQALQEGLK